MKNQLLRIIAVAVVASLVLISWMKSRSEANADYESNKVEVQAPKEATTSQISFSTLDNS